MATPISRDILNEETNARFYAQSGLKPGYKLDPKNPTDKAYMPVWRDIYRKVKAEADAGTLVTTYDRPEVAQPLADAELASTVAAVHVDAGAKSSDPAMAQQHAAAAATAMQVAAQKLREAAANQPPIVSPKLMQDAVKEAAKTTPPPHAPAADQIAHAQTQNGKNGQLLRPEDDPWAGQRYVPKSKSPPEQTPAQPSKSPRERPSREVLYRETNNRFWLRHGYKRGQKLDMSDPKDLEMSKIWNDIFREVQREANAGRLTFTSPELVPTPNGVRPELAPTPNGTRPPPSRPTPPPSPPTQQTTPPPDMATQLPSWLPSWLIPGMQQPVQRPVQQPVQQPVQPVQPVQQMQRMQQLRQMQQMQQLRQMQQMQSRTPSIQTEAAPSPSSSTQETPTTQSTEGGSPTTETTTVMTETETEPTTEGAPAETTGMSGGTIALIVLSLVGAAGVTYAVTRKPAGRTVAFRPRAKSTRAATSAPSFAFPPSRGGRF